MPNVLDGPLPTNEESMQLARRHRHLTDLKSELIAVIKGYNYMTPDEIDYAVADLLDERGKLRAVATEKKGK